MSGKVFQIGRNYPTLFGVSPLAPVSDWVGSSPEAEPVYIVRIFIYVIYIYNFYLDKAYRAGFRDLV